MSNYRQLRDSCRTTDSCVICAELSAVALFVPNYRQLRDLCRTIRLTSPHLIVSCYTTQQTYTCGCTVDVSWITSLVTSVQYKDIWTSFHLRTKAILLLNAHRERSSVLWTNVTFDIDVWHSATPCILLSKIHLLWRGSFQAILSSLPGKQEQNGVENIQ